MTSEEAAKRATDEFTAWMLHRGSTPGDEMADTLKGTIMAAIDGVVAPLVEQMQDHAVQHGCCVACKMKIVLYEDHLDGCTIKQAIDGHRDSLGRVRRDAHRWTAHFIQRRMRGLASGAAVTTDANREALWQPVRETLLALFDMKKPPEQE